MKYKRTIYLGLIVCLVAATAFATPEAEYGKISKAWILHADGSQEYRHYMELTLFTHTAMNDVYGESFITYNPDYQELKIHASYTRQKDGTIIQTPDNAFVEGLPYFAANAPAYNQLKEMVVVHTGLELGATIYLDYSIITKAGYYPALDINEKLQETSPVKTYEISVSVPTNTPFTWQLYGNDTKARETTKDGNNLFQWTLNNIPASSREPFQPRNLDEMPRLIASSYTSSQEALGIMKERFKASGSYECKTFGAYLTENITNEEEKVKTILEHVVNHLDYCLIPLQETGYSIRDIDESLRSAYGTLAEKTYLLNVLLNAAGIPSEVVAVFPNPFNSEACGLSAIKDWAVKTTVAGKDQYLSAISLTPSSITTRGALDRVVTLENQQISLTAEPTIIQINDTVKVSQKPSVNDLVVCTLPTPAEGIDTWRMNTLSSHRSSLFELPSLLKEEVTYTVLPEKDLRLLTSTEEIVIEKPFGKLTRTIQPGIDATLVKYTLELNKQQFSPSEYNEIRTLINAWVNPNNRVLLWEFTEKEKK